MFSDKKIWYQAYFADNIAIVFIIKKQFIINENYDNSHKYSYIFDIT